MNAASKHERLVELMGSGSDVIRPGYTGQARHGVGLLRYPMDMAGDYEAARPGPVTTYVDESLIRKRGRQEEVGKVSITTTIELSCENFMRLVREGKSLDELGSAFGQSNEEVLEFAAQDWPDEFLPCLQAMIRNEATPKLADSTPARPAAAISKGGIGVAAPPTTAPLVPSRPAARPELPGYPELTRESLEAAIRAGRSIRECAEMFDVTEATINRKKVEWNLVGMSPNRRGGKHPQRQSIPQAGQIEAPVPGPALGPAAPPDRFAITVRRASIPCGEVASMLTGLSDYFKAGSGRVSLKLDIEEVSL